MTWTSGLLAGIATLLHTEGVATWRASGAYQPGEIPIVMSALPPDPDTVLVLESYTVGQDGHGDVTVGVQVRTRGTTDPRVVQDLSDAARDALDGLALVQVGGVWVSQIVHRSGAPLGRDANDRHERSDNYYVQARRETALRTD